MRSRVDIIAIRATDVRAIEVKAGMLPFVWLLASLSPVLATVCAAVLYERDCRKRPDADRRLTGVVYTLILFSCAVVAYPVGVLLGINWECPSAGNLCGLAGFFVVGPVASALAILLATGLLTGLGSRQP